MSKIGWPLPRSMYASSPVEMRAVFIARSRKQFNAVFEFRAELLSWLLLFAAVFFLCECLFEERELAPHDLEVIVLLDRLAFVFDGVFVVAGGIVAAAECIEKACST